ncbi:MAG: L-seryl-tRNA(Sec) selenium transferase, partial [Vicinamibacterales bacterium]
GDKLLGGPQAGLIAGTRRWIAEIASNPLHRAVRCDKLALAALEATLRIYQQSPDPVRDIPTLAWLTRPVDQIAAVAREAQPRLQAALGPGYRVSVEDAKSQVGSGALPTDELPTKVLVVVHDTESAERIAERFRSAATPIIGRIHEDRFLLDLRTVLDPADVIPVPPVPLV